ncbi:unnamed protein product, partial [Rotaria sp. Silwood2]
YGIFDYLDGYDIYKAFSYLNQRFQKLLSSSSLLLKVTLYGSMYSEPYISGYKLYLLLSRGISLPIVTNQRLSTIEYLSIDHSWTYNELFSIMSYTSQLRRLHLFNAYDFRTNIQSILPITLSKLTDISIPMNRLKFHEFEIIIRKIDVKLKVLRVKVQSQDITFLVAHRWEKLILESLPHLEEFYLQYIENFNREYHYPGVPDQFISSFWIKRQWTFEVEIDHESINYFVRLYRKRWYEYTQEKILNSSVEYSKSTRLIITFVDNDDFEEPMTIDTTHILTVAQIYHLEISEETVHVAALIEVVSLLSELTILKIYSLSLHGSRILNSEELLTLASMEDRSKNYKSIP